MASSVTGDSPDALKRRPKVWAHDGRSFVRDGEADTEPRRGRLMVTMTRIGQLWGTALLLVVLGRDDKREGSDAAERRNLSQEEGMMRLYHAREAGLRNLRGRRGPCGITPRLDSCR